MRPIAACIDIGFYTINKIGIGGLGMELGEEALAVALGYFQCRVGLARAWGSLQHHIAAGIEQMPHFGFLVVAGKWWDKIDNIVYKFLLHFGAPIAHLGIHGQPLLDDSDSSIVAKGIKVYNARCRKYRFVSLGHSREVRIIGTHHLKQIRRS